jgi:tRNA (mo5U34)-methyltransferase
MSQLISSRPSSVRIEREIDQLGPWFHNLHLPDGTQTYPDHWLGDFPSFKWHHLADHIPQDLAGWDCLDIGCNAGFYTFELAKRGAKVVGIDVDDRYLCQARWAAQRLNLEPRVQFERMQVYDLAHVDRTFDLVLFTGVLYHLRYPLLGMDIVTQKVKHLLVFQTLAMPGEAAYDPLKKLEYVDRDMMQHPGWPKMAFLEHGFAGDPTNWWSANRACVEAMLRSTGMKILKRPIEEIYICEPDPDQPRPMMTWNRSEFLSATGQPWL